MYCNKYIKMWTLLLSPILNSKGIRIYLYDFGYDLISMSDFIQPAYSTITRIESRFIRSHFLGEYPHCYMPIELLIFNNDSLTLGSSVIFVWDGIYNFGPHKHSHDEEYGLICLNTLRSRQIQIHFLA